MDLLSLLEKAAALGRKLAAKVQGDRARSSSGVTSMCEGLRRQAVRRSGNVERGLEYSNSAGSDVT